MGGKHPSLQTPIDTPLRRIAVLIPAWKPEPALVPIVTALRAAGVGTVLLVDDGSGAASAAIFADAVAARAELISHAVNLGKGRALKTGFNALLLRAAEFDGVVTADADGQHTAEDIVRVAAALRGATRGFVLGCRAFSGAVPLRSRFGNALTRRIFGFVTGMRVSDTQTGLRGFRMATLPRFMAVDGERYEYEMGVLAQLCREGERPVEVAIATVYIENNRSSHFDPVWDSMRIYFVLARFYLSSIVAAGVDFAGFTLTFAATHHLLLAVAVGRLSSLVNFALNRRFVFHSGGSMAGALWRYYVLAAAIAGVSYGLISLATQRAGWNVFAAKVAVDGLLSLASFSVQRTFVFGWAERSA